MKAITILNAFNAHQFESIPNQFITLDGSIKNLKEAIFGEGGKIYAATGIEAGLYLYLYIDDAEQKALYNCLIDAANGCFVNAIGVDVEGQEIVVIKCE